MSLNPPSETAESAGNVPMAAICRDDVGLSVPYEAPASDIERKLAEIWRSVLNISPIGTDDDFFELGGDSFAATVVASQIESELNVSFSPANIIHHSTVRDQAIYLAEQASADVVKVPDYLVPFNVNGSKTPFFLVHGAAGIVLLGPDFMKSIGEDQPVYLVQAPGMDGRARPCETVEEFAEVYIKAMRQIQPEGPYRIGATCTGSFICLEICSQLKAVGEEVEKLILIDPPLHVADIPFPKLQSLSELPGYPRLVRRWTKKEWQRLLSRLQIFGHLMSERKRVRKQKRLQGLFERRQAKGGSREKQEKTYEVDTMLDVSLKLHQAVTAYAPKEYDGHAFMLVTEKRAVNAKPESLYSNKIRSITSQIVSSNHKKLFTEDIDHVSAFIRSSLQS